MEGFGHEITQWQHINLPLGASLPSLEEVEAVVVTGSPVSVYDYLPWSVRAGEWLAEVIQRERPVLGVCYGHQLIAEALGGRVERSHKGREMGAVKIHQVGEDSLFAGLPQSFEVWQTHIDEVTHPPLNAQVIAYNEHCGVQAMAIGDHCRTVQWHPEMSYDIMKYYVQARETLIDQEWGAGSAQHLIKDLPDSLESGRLIFSNFAQKFLVSHYEKN